MRTSIAGLTFSAVLIAFVACNGTATRSGSSPSSVTAPSSSSVSVPFAVSGVVSAFRGGPVAGASITARPNFPPGHGTKTTMTDDRGSYRIDGLMDEILLDVEKPGYIPSGRSGIPTQNSVVNLTLNQKVSVAAGDAIVATIWGDDDLMWDDPIPFGCHTPTACKAVFVSTDRAGPLAVRVLWDGAAELGVKLLTNPLTADGPSADGPSPLEISGSVPPGENIVVVRFDKAGGTRPPAGASQVFRLEAR